MCSIFILEPGQMIDHQKLDNVIANNLDGYGIILQDKNSKTLEVVRAYTEGGTKTEDVQQILEFNKDKRRIVHVRNQTAGVLNQDNVHPFKVFESEDRDVWMMHNGTIGDFRPIQGDTRSDTVIFGTDFVKPLLSRFSGGFGLGDYNDPVIKKILAKIGDVGFVNRLIFVSNDLEPLLLGNWIKIKQDDNSEFVASNDSYFKSIVRGPRKAVVPFQGYQSKWTPTHGTTGGAASGQSSSQVSLQQTQPKETQKEEKKVTPLSQVKLTNNITSDYQPPAKVLEAIDGWYEDYGLYSMVFLKYDEVVNLVKSLNTDELAGILLDVCETMNQAECDLDVAEQQIKDLQRNIFSNPEDFDSYEDLKREIEILENKHTKSTKHNATMVEENSNLKSEITRLNTQIKLMEGMMSGSYIEKAA